MAAMDFGSARDRVRSLIAQKKPSQQSRSALTPDPLRDNIIDEEGQRTERFREAAKRKPEIDYEVKHEDGTAEQKRFTWDGYGDALKDVARAGFSFDDPQLQSPENVLGSRQINRELLADYMRSDPFAEQQPYTRGNPMESIWAGLTAGQVLKDKAQTHLAEHIARSEQMGEQEEAQQSAEDMLENLRRRAREQSKGGGRPDRDTRKGINRALRQIAKAQGGLEQLLTEQAQSSFAQDVRAVANEMAEEAAEAVEGFSSLPGCEAGNPTNLTPDQQIELAEKWAQQREMVKIVKALGRMYRDMRFKRQARTKAVPEQPVGITTGRHLDRLVPQELARAAMPALRATFAKDFSEYSLLEYEMIGYEPAGKGPIVAVVDGSGSMSGERFTWASSVELAVFKLAQADKRSFAGVEFGSVGELKSWVFPKGKPVDPHAVFDMASHFYGGGTSTVSGMSEALRIINEESGFKTADVVLIGDGCDQFGAADQRVRDQLRELGVRIHGITIETGANPYFEQMCEWHMDVQDLAGPNDATDQLAQQIT
jgi:uncharacterized protein with von Willebrand factor type A (vWA) domain